MSTLISTEQVPADQRMDLIREALSKARMAPVDFRPADAGDFRFVLRYVDLGALRVVRVAATPYRARRTPALIRRADPDLLSLAVSLSGHGSLSQFDRDARAAPGELVIQDVRRPYSIGNPGGSPGLFKGVHVTFPRALLPLPADQLKQLVATPIGADRGIGSLTSLFLAQLARDMDHYQPAEAARLATAALEVLAVRLAHELDQAGRIPPETHRRALLTRIHAFVQQHLGDPELSPGMIAAACHVSLSYLHRLFQQDGQSVAGWIRQRRLEGCRRDLADPALTSRTVAAIAAHWGFASATHFSQAFKATYGTPPGEYRRLAATGAGDQPVHGFASTVH